jgi:hypothetical protein
MTLMIRETNGLRLTENLVLSGGLSIRDTPDGVPELEGAYCPGVKASLAANVAIGANTATALVFKQESFDDASFHFGSANPTRFTVPAGRGGKYLVIAHVVFTDAAESARVVQIRRNGSNGAIDAEGTLVEGGSGTTVSVSTILGLNGGEYLEVMVTSGAAVQVCGGGTRYTTFTMVRLGT